jgi:hypothetical protein
MGTEFKDGLLAEEASLDWMSFRLINCVSTFTSDS